MASRRETSNVHSEAAAALAPETNAGLQLVSPFFLRPGERVAGS